MFLVDAGVNNASDTHAGTHTWHRHRTDGADVSHRQHAPRSPTRDRWRREVTPQQLLGFVWARSVGRRTGAVLALMLPSTETPPRQRQTHREVGTQSHGSGTCLMAELPKE